MKIMKISIYCLLIGLLLLSGCCSLFQEVPDTVEVNARAEPGVLELDQEGKFLLGVKNKGAHLAYVVR